MSSPRIFLSPPHMSGNEITYIKQAFESNWIAPLGPNVDKFEKDMTEYLGEGHCVAMSSGTAAIHIALELSNVSTGDLVLCSSFTFVASANPILYLGATPIFVDSESESWNICPVALEKAITSSPKSPKALIAVDLLGQSANYQLIEEICKKYNIILIEDSAEALGAKLNDKKCGTFGDFGIFSFNGNKILSTSGGGMLVCRTKEQAEKAKFLITQARDDAPYYKHSVVGYNYRMSNVIAGIGIAQLQVLEKRVQKRKEIFGFYKEKFAEFSFIKPMSTPENGIPNSWLSSFSIESNSSLNPSDIIDELEKNNIEARRLWKPLHLQPLFKNCLYYSKIDGHDVSQELFNRGLSLPSGSSLSNKDLERISAILIKLFRKY